jgi:hypothetical protein
MTLYKTITITTEQHKKIKAMAVESGKPLRDYLEELLEKILRKKK